MNYKKLPISAQRVIEEVQNLLPEYNFLENWYKEYWYTDYSSENYTYFILEDKKVNSSIVYNLYGYRVDGLIYVNHLGRNEDEEGFAIMDSSMFGDMRDDDLRIITDRPHRGFRKEVILHPEKWEDGYTMDPVQIAYAIDPTVVDNIIKMKKPGWVKLAAAKIGLV